MEFNDLLKKKGIEPNTVLALRHSPPQPELRKVLPWLVAEHHAIFNAYQQTQTPRVEKAMLQRKYVASFIGLQTGKALFIGLYRIGENRSINEEEYWQFPEYQKLVEYGISWATGNNTRERIYWFDLRICEDFYTEWKGKLVVNWPPPDISFCRNAENNVFGIDAILEESRLVRTMPDWAEIVWSYAELNIVPRSWQERMSQWRGVYFIFDKANSKGYVGSAYGVENIIGRWRDYARTGDGGNKYLRRCDPANLVFSILEIDSHDRAPNEIVRKENSWKERLHTRHPHGLNAN